MALKTKLRGQVERGGGLKRGRPLGWKRKSSGKFEALQTVIGRIIVEKYLGGGIGRTPHQVDCRCEGKRRTQDAFQAFDTTTEWGWGGLVGKGFQVRARPALSKLTLVIQVEFRGQWNM